MSPILTWHVKLPSETEYAPTSEKYLGTASSVKELEVSLRLWNNRYGTEDVSDLKSFAVRLSFSCVEDSALLKYCSLKLNSVPLDGQLVGGHMIYALPNGVWLSGKANNGISADNTANYKDFILSFNTPGDIQLKENDLKNLYVEVVSI